MELSMEITLAAETVQKAFAHLAKGFCASCKSAVAPCFLAQNAFAHPAKGFSASCKSALRILQQGFAHPAKVLLHATRWHHAPPRIEK